jgi:hypothetical protein
LLGVGPSCGLGPLFGGRRVIRRGWVVHCG